MTPLIKRAEAVAAVAGQHADAVDQAARFPAEAVASMKANGLLGAMIPTEFGGEGASLADIAEVCACISQQCASSGMIYAMHQIKASSVISHGKDAPWHQDFMRKIAKNQWLLGSATTEGGIGGDLRNSICAVEVTGDQFHLEKDATVISYGSQADAILVTARRAPDAASNDQVMIVGLKDQYSLAKTHDWDTLGMRGTCSDGFKFVIDAPAVQILPRPFAEIAAQSMLATCHLLWSAVWFGIANNAVIRAQNFVRAAARQRPDVTPPGALRVAEAANMLHLMKSNTLEGLKRFESALTNDDDLMSMGFAVSMNNVKIAASRMVLDIVNHTMLVCGIMGYKNGTPYSLGRHLRDAHSAQLMISNDRIFGNTSNMLLVHRLDSHLLA